MGRGGQGEVSREGWSGRDQRGGMVRERWSGRGQWGGDCGRGSKAILRLLGAALVLGVLGVGLVCGAGCPGRGHGGSPKHRGAMHVFSRNNCEKDAVTIALVNSMTSLYASIAVFSVLGFKAANDHGRCLDR